MTTLCDQGNKMNLKQKLQKMRHMAEKLMPITYPRVDFKKEQDIMMLKQSTIMIDGYEVVLCASKANYDSYMLESLQLQATNHPFLPFNLVCKVGKECFGTEGLSYIDFFKNNKKVYCWAVKSFEGEILPPGDKCERASFEGLDFSLLAPGSVDLY